MSPMRTPPHPGTAVNAAARSIVDRMNRRSSPARSWREGASRGRRRGRGREDMP
jgi:hypothetical protein